MVKWAAIVSLLPDYRVDFKKCELADINMYMHMYTCMSGNQCLRKTLKLSLCHIFLKGEEDKRIQTCTMTNGEHFCR